jgi:hypothetical protein
VAWWAWVLFWTALVAGATGVMFVLGRSLWRKSMELFHELGTAADRLGVLDQELAALVKRSAPPDDLAVFADPAQLRQARLQARSRRSSPARPPRHRGLVARPTEPGRPRSR